MLCYILRNIWFFFGSSMCISFMEQSFCIPEKITFFMFEYFLSTLNTKKICVWTIVHIEDNLCNQYVDRYIKQKKIKPSQWWYVRTVMKLDINYTFLLLTGKTKLSYPDQIDVYINDANVCENTCIFKFFMFKAKISHSTQSNPFQITHLSYLFPYSLSIIQPNPSNCSQMTPTNSW